MMKITSGDEDGITSTAKIAIISSIMITLIMMMLITMMLITMMVKGLGLKNHASFLPSQCNQLIQSIINYTN